MKSNLLYVLLFLLLTSCGGGASNKAAVEAAAADSLKAMLAEYVEVDLKADLAYLPSSDRRMLALLIEASDIIDRLFWVQAFGNHALIDSIANPELKLLAHINYGPWERLNADRPFIKGYGPKAPGSNFYPKDMTREEFDALADKSKTSPYTMIRRDAAGKLVSIPYHVYFKSDLEQAAKLIRQAAEWTFNAPLKKYLLLRAAALQTDSYHASDVAWLAVSESPFDFIVGPIENYEDLLYGYKASYLAMVMQKDDMMSRLQKRFSDLVPPMFKELPCDEKYKREMPRNSKDENVGVYDVLYCAGENNAGGKTIAMSLPNDEQIRKRHGSRKLIQRNVMKIKFDKIMRPIAEQMIDQEQLPYAQFEAFFKNSMYRQVAQGLSQWQTVDGKVTIREALKETFVDIDETRAEVSTLFVARQLHQKGEISAEELKTSYVTYVANIFRSMRFGTQNTHSISTSIIFNRLLNSGAIERTTSGRYKINVEKTSEIATQLLTEIIVLQGDGNYEKALEIIAVQGVMSETLVSDLLKVKNANIPRDIRYRQGEKVLGLE